MPTINWNEIKSRAIRFSRTWTDVRAANIRNTGGHQRTRERAEAQTFWNDFFQVFGIERRVVASFEEPVKNLKGDTNYIDLFYKGVLIAEHKSPGKSLDKAHAQAMDYIQSLHRQHRSEEVPKYVVVCDFARIALYDLEPKKEKEQGLIFALKDLPKHVRRFGFLLDISDEPIEEQEDADLRASRIMSELHDALKAGGYKGHELERMLVRILFCLFADSSAILADDPDIRPFSRYVSRTRVDGSDVGPALARLFSVLDKPRDQRQANLDEDLASLPYVNGALFAERLDLADFDAAMRQQLITCCHFNWSKISPAVFGSLFQGVMDNRERRQLGAHYTGEGDIMKLIKSLFLEDLRAELDTIQNLVKKSDRNARLRDFQDKLRSLKFLDPACGCGNFLVLSYRELRRLELDILKTLHADQRVMNLQEIIKVNVDQFYGIEIEEWPARIAEVAMWLMDHQMNQEAADAFALPMLRLPLSAIATIRQANALTIDWNDVLPASECSYVLGNPPFVGKQFMTANQNADVERVAGRIAGHAVLDYVTLWYFKAAAYVNVTTPIAFVSTNSVTQGEQVSILWTELFRLGISLHFGHRTFTWQSEARGKAHVHVVIIGIGKQQRPNPYIVLYQLDGGPPTGLRVSVTNLSPYLIDAPNILVRSRTTPLSNVPLIVFGSMPNEAKPSPKDLIGLPEDEIIRRTSDQLLMDTAERDALLSEQPEAEKWIRPILGSKEFINGIERWCLWMVDIKPSELRAMPAIMRRVQIIKENRLRSTREATRKLAGTSWLFGENRQPSSPYLLIPSASSEARPYIPMAFLPPNVIASNLALVIPNANLYHFGVLSSTMHLAWVRTVCGRLKSDYRYSNTLVYNNYPWPSALSTAQVRNVEAAAQGVLDARNQHPGQTLADLYDPNTMPIALASAHKALDTAVDRCYADTPFTIELKRIQYLFSLYETQATLFVTSSPIAKKGRKRH